MNALLELEPRDAGTAFAEPEIEFEDNRNPLREMVMCSGCCTYGSEIIVWSHSTGQ